MRQSRTRVTASRILVASAAWLAVWSVASILPLGDPLLPSPLAVIVQAGRTFPIWWSHWFATTSRGLIALLVSGFLSVLFATLVTAIPTTRFLILALAGAFSFPLVLLVPLSTIVFESGEIPVVVAVIAAFFPLVFQLWQGMREVEGAWLDFAAVANSSRATVLSIVRFPAALPSFLSGLEAAVPAVLLGSMLGELAGSRWGLGVYLVTTLTTGSPVTSGAVTLICVATALLPLLVVRAAQRYLALARASIDIDGSDINSQVFTLRSALLAASLGIFIWWISSKLTANTYFFKGPAETIRFLISDEVIWEAFANTLLTAILGLTVSVAFSIMMALASLWFPAIRVMMSAPLMISQATPIVALVPVLAVALGRGAAVEVAITVSASFFPCLLVMLHAFSSTPRLFLDIGNSVGASRFQTLRIIQVPSSIGQALGGVRLAGQRAFMGAILAEYVATRNGLGGMVYDSRGRLDFSPIWAAALLCVVTSQAIDAIMTFVAARFAGARKAVSV